MPEAPRDVMAAIETELQGERAFSLGEAGKKIERLLAELAASVPALYEDALYDAATAVWYYLIIRESMGMYDHDEALKVYNVPSAVRAKVGVVRPAK